jgi:hypothetical protein
MGSEMNQEEHRALKENSSLTKLTAVLVLVATLSIGISWFLITGAVEEYQGKVNTNTGNISTNTRSIQTISPRVEALETKVVNVDDKLNEMFRALNNINTWVEIQKDREKRDNM